MFRRHDALARSFRLDIRSLALLRISLSLLLLYDLAVRAGDLPILYSEAGFLTIRDSIRQAGFGGWSLYWLSGDIRFTAALLAANALAAFCLLVGWRTTWMTALTWVLLVSLQNRNILLINGGDVWFRMMLMWGVFLPWGEVWSLDARRARRLNAPPPANPQLTPGTVCLVLQTSLVYFYGGLLKVNERWLGFNPWDALADLRLPEGAAIGGDAMQRAFSYIAYARPLAAHAVEYPALLRLVSLGTPFFEFLLVALILWPFRDRRVRFWTIIAATLFHLSIEVFLFVGQFSLIAVSAWWAMLPPFFWNNRGWRRFFPTSAQARPEATLPTNATEPSPAEPATRWDYFATGCCTLLMGMILYWNAASVFRKDIRNFMRAPLQPIANTLLLRQTWNMFSRPSATQSRFLYAGELADGRQVEILRNELLAATDMLPDHDSYPNHRWRKLHAGLENRQHEAYRQRLVEALFRRWNATHPAEDQLTRLTMYRFIVSTVDPARPPRRVVAATVPKEPRTK